ncbi:glutathione S-transferase [Pectobacterium brasiliense]|uniref:glutathione S-transferase family protein n=1 Tax=Pectobacterium brasiliense TaxID=180957 RepID=UPI00057D6B80|nr:glutathione S-transferase [Pectobacterium brasiliense]KHS88056.1 glutathione S-transferase [Pectobacterium brasiliense]MBA0196123.1 glutathione S-transferase [Pectobacterium brasiliense]MBN3093739.1 glutathione S-transferase [Pectobacterium brasiliense]MBN3140281.1 glutathione S-transferase [Pectobacterium brasiliense]MBW5896884.1 glutathione S-transferase [Pectobacterium brasiliense]
MGLKLHHLNDSRSVRILWLLEEAGIPYELVRYQRDEKTHLAPASLRAIHPLGKSPLIEEDGKIIAESGAIVEYLINRHAKHLAPDASAVEYIDYLQWIHFAESSAMLPVLLKIFGEFEKNTGTTLNFLEDYADNEFEKVFSFLDDALSSREFIVGDKLSGADIMLGFVINTVVERLVPGERFPNIHRYSQRLKNLPSWQKTQAIESRAE